MKKVLTVCAALAILAILATGCATAVPMGWAYAQLQVPLTATPNPSVAPKVGSATCQSWFGVVAMGDASIEKAMQNGNIKKIHYVDWHIKNIAGFCTYKVMVYGE